MKVLSVYVIYNKRKEQKTLPKQPVFNFNLKSK